MFDGKFDGTSFGKVRSPMNSYPSDESIRPEQVESEGDPNPSIGTTPQLVSESGTKTNGDPTIRIRNRIRMLKESRKRKQYQEARWRKQNKESACKLMLHMMELAKTSSKVYLKNLYESFNRGEGQLFNLFQILLNPVLILDSRFFFGGDTYLRDKFDAFFNVSCILGVFLGGGGIWDFFLEGGESPRR